MKIALYTIWVLFFAAAAVTCFRTVRKTKNHERLLASWPKVQATVTGSRQGWTNGGGNSTRSICFWPGYQFYDPRGVLYVGESEVSCANRPIPGSYLEVAYNPESPNQSFEVATQSKQMIGCLIPALVFLGIASFWFIGFVSAALGL